MDDLAYLHERRSAVDPELRSTFDSMLIGALSVYVSNEDWIRSVDNVTNWIKGGK
jgi:hypothetical protein